MSSLKRAMLIPLLSSLVFGCTVSPQATVARRYAAQIIIKFSDPGIDPTPAEFIEHLSKDAGLPLVYLRPMSGGAHLFRLERITNQDHLAEVIKRLGKRRDVLYVEQDRVLRHQ